MFAEEDIERKRRQEEIDLLLENDDAVWREERKKRMMGKFAGLERGEVEEILREEMEKEVAGELICCSMFVCAGCAPFIYSHILLDTMKQTHIRKRNESPTGQSSRSLPNHARTHRIRLPRIQIQLPNHSSLGQIALLVRTRRFLRHAIRTAIHGGRQCRRS
jgi:hypothetical protein